MGHAIHFLERLERLDAVQMDFALNLYRDSALTRYILALVRLPEGVDRVAIALEDHDDGAHIILTRDGHFVTCLAAGMSVGGLPVVTRSRLEALCAQADTLRDAAAQLSCKGDARVLLDKIFTSGSALAREDFRVLLALSGVFGPYLRDSFLIVADYLLSFRDRYKPGRYRRLSSSARDELYLYWQSSWALGHIMMLLGPNIRSMIIPQEVLDARDLDELAMRNANVLSWPATRTLNVAVALRGAWCMARVGKSLLATYKRHFDHCESFCTGMDATLTLTAMGLRHRRLRTEVNKLFTRRSTRETGAEKHPDIENLMKIIALYGSVILEGEAEAREQHREFTAEYLVEMTAKLPKGDPRRFERPDDVPDELAWALPFNLDSTLYSDPHMMAGTFTYLPWLAQAEAEELYLPRATLEAYEWTWQPKSVLDQLGAYRMLGGGRTPTQRKQPKIGRNDLCPCGSGKKHKRCCGAA